MVWDRPEVVRPGGTQHLPTQVGFCGRLTREKERVGTFV